MALSLKLRRCFLLIICISLIVLVQLYIPCVKSSYARFKSLRDFLVSQESPTAIKLSSSDQNRTANDDATRGVFSNCGDGVKKDVYSIYGKGVSLQDWKTAKALWRPDTGKLNKLYRYLNVSKEDAPRHLPLTLDPDYPYLLHNPRLCGHDVIDVLVMLHIRPDNFGRRTGLRSAICHRSFHPFTARCVFLLGSVGDPDLQDRLNQEHEMYGDLLQGRFVDDYHNLTHKGVMGFNWITHHCPHVLYVLKLDDDVFVDTFKLMFSFLPSFRGHQRSIVCNAWLNYTMKILREGRWQVDDALFHNLGAFPYAYCSGFAVLFTGDLIPELYAAAFFAPFFWVDDIYLFGILPAMAGNSTIFYRGPFHEVLSNDFHDCLEKEGRNCTMVLGLIPNAKKYQDSMNMTYHLHMLPSKLLEPIYVN